MATQTHQVFTDRSKSPHNPSHLVSSSPSYKDPAEFTVHMQKTLLFRPTSLLAVAFSQAFRWCCFSLHGTDPATISCCEHHHRLPSPHLSTSRDRYRSFKGLTQHHRSFFPSGHRGRWHECATGRGRQPHRRVGGRPRGAAPLRGGRPLEHHRAPARARGASTPRREEDKRGGGGRRPPTAVKLNTEYARHMRLRRTRPGSARGYTRTRRPRPRHNHEGSPARTTVYFYTRGTTEKRLPGAVHVYQSWPRPRRAGEPMPLYVQQRVRGRAHQHQSGEIARTPTSIRRDCAHTDINQERFSTNRQERFSRPHESLFPILQELFGEFFQSGGAWKHYLTPPTRNRNTCRR